MLNKVFEKSLLGDFSFERVGKMSKELEAKEIRMSALDMIITLSFVFDKLDLTHREQYGAVKFVSTILTYYESDELRNEFNEILHEIKSEIFADIEKRKNKSQNTQDAAPAKTTEIKEDAVQPVTDGSQNNGLMEKALNNPNIPAAIKKLIIDAKANGIDIEFVGPDAIKE